MRLPARPGWRPFRALVLVAALAGVCPSALARSLAEEQPTGPGNKLMVEKQLCKQPEPSTGKPFKLVINRFPELLPQQDETEALMMQYKEAATLVTHGKLHSLGHFSPEASTPTLHVFHGGDAAEYDAAGQPLSYRAVAVFKCNEQAGEDVLASVGVSSEEGQERTYIFSMETSRVCPNQPPCEAPAAQPILEGEYVVHKPSLVRQKCPGTYLAAHACEAGPALTLSPLGSASSELARWRIAPVATGAAGDLLSQPVTIRSVGRASTVGCSPFLDVGAAAAECGAAVGAAALGEAAAQWLVEPGPPPPPGGLANRYFLRSAALAAAGCPKSLLCLRLACDGPAAAPAFELCSEEDAELSSVWHLRSADFETALARARRQA